MPQGEIETFLSRQGFNSDNKSGFIVYVLSLHPDARIVVDRLKANQTVPAQVAMMEHRMQEAEHSRMRY